MQDSFITADDLGMSTTLGSWAFVGAKATKNSAIAQLLIDAGLIILGKGNMTVGILPWSSFYLANTTVRQEFAGMKMTTIMSGWSSHGGQTLSPYVGEIEENKTLIGHSVSITTDKVVSSV